MDGLMERLTLFEFDPWLQKMTGMINKHEHHVIFMYFALFNLTKLICKVRRVTLHKLVSLYFRYVRLEFFSIYAYIIQISLQLAFQKGIFNVHFKSNNKVVVDAFNDSRSFDNEVVLISQYCAILPTHNDNQLPLIWRQVIRLFIAWITHQ